MADRMGNGVKCRHDGQGDAWANEHRSALGSGDYLHDVDTLFGIQVFGHNTGEKLFLEYEPDNFENRAKILRSFAVVAMFDRKSSSGGAFCPENRLSLSFYLWQCRMFAQWQPTPPRFFIVIGGQSPPWQMIELDIYTGKKVGVPVQVDGSRFADVWNALGLRKLRRELKSWITEKQREQCLVVEDEQDGIPF